MRSILPPAVDATSVFDQIAAAKQPPRPRRMKMARKNVISAYKEYEDAAPEVGGLDDAHLTDLQKEALLHAFNVETEPMTTLRGALLERIDAALCPFCGISESSTLDHYLPKERHPEFSVFPKNLIPSCPNCNARKGKRILIEGTDVRMFLHPYYDLIPNLAFLDVRVHMKPDALSLSYQITRPAGMALRTFRHLQSHFDELDLADRYRRMGLEHVGEQYPALRRAYGPGKDAARVATKLIEVAEDFEEAMGLNFWRAKLYRALASNHDFCDGGFEAIRVQS